MQSTLSIRRVSEDEFESYRQRSSLNYATHSQVALPSFPHSQRAFEQHGFSRMRRSVAPNHVPMLGRPSIVPARPWLVPNAVPGTKVRRAPVLVQTNRILRTVLVALCGVAILGYGLDVAASHDVSKLQDQARRLNEQNSELSAQLLQSISYQGIQESSLGRFGLHTAEHVVVAKEVPPPKVPAFKPGRHHFPIMAGY